MNGQSPFHEGELAVQALAKESEIAQRNSVVVSSQIIDGAIPFIAQQHMAVISSTAENGQIWISVLFGEPGFITAPNVSNVLINPQKIVNQKTDPLWSNIEVNSQVGLLVIELSTRRRLRVNGNITLLDNGFYEIKVAQAYPNCPKYIQRRQPSLSAEVLNYKTPAPLSGLTLTNEQQSLISSSDSFFVGSGVSEFHNDASYRGGEPGFVSVIDDGQLLIPDYQGNSMFNTLGNFQSNPNAGLVFIDFESNKLLQLTGTAKILWDYSNGGSNTGGTNRYWLFNLNSWQETTLPSGLNWTFFDYSPHNPKQKALNDLELVVSDIEQKSERIKLFRLKPKDGSVLPDFEPGSHLPIEVKLPSGKKALRHYSILSSNDDHQFYEIAVQQEKNGGGGSNYMHNKLRAGLMLRAKYPVNEFLLASAGKHHILIAGGIGITPILSMLRQLSKDNESFELHYSVKNKSDLAFKEEVEKLAGKNVHFYFTQDANSSRLDIQSLLSAENQSSHIYICGPIGMINAVKEEADENGWQPGQIHYESFGSSIQESNKSIEVKLEKSGKVIVVNPKETILEGLLAAKVAVPFECRKGECGMCATEYLEGDADHRDVYLTKEEKKSSLCVCVSRAKSQSITLNL